MQDEGSRGYEANLLGHKDTSRGGIDDLGIIGTARDVLLLGFHGDGGLCGAQDEVGVVLDWLVLVLALC